MDKSRVSDNLQEILYCSSVGLIPLSEQAVMDLNRNFDAYVDAMADLANWMSVAGSALGAYRSAMPGSLPPRTAERARTISVMRSVLRELTAEITMACPVCNGEQEIESSWEGQDFDGSYIGDCILACGHSALTCDNSWSTGPSHDQYSVKCEQPVSGHLRSDHSGNLLHSGRNALSAEGEEIVFWEGGGYCAGDPLPVHVVTREAAREAL